MSSSFTANKALSVTTFLDSIGINGEASSSTIVSQLAYLGINHLRTDMATASQLLAAGADGAKIDVLIPWYLHSITSTDLQSTLTQIDPASSVIEAIEGPNEVNNLSDSYNDLTGPASVEAEQEEIYALVRADPNLNNATKSMTVYDFSVIVNTASGIYSGMQNYADYNNVHAYGDAGIPPAWFLSNEVGAVSTAANKPTVITETGASTISGTSGVDQMIQARYEIKALLDAYQLGIVRTYLYAVQDQATGSNVSNSQAYYGLYNTDGSIKLAGTAVHNFTSMLSQGNNDPVAGSTLSYSISGMPYYGDSELFAKGGGAFDLTLWNETTDWDATAAAEIKITTNEITINLANNFRTISVYDPLISSGPIQTITNSSSITVNLNDDPLIIQLTPMPQVDTLVVQVSEDAWKGDARFAVLVNGQQIGGTLVASALHDLGDSNVFVLTGTWSASANVQIQFLNDAYGGTSSTDRNLYVNSVGYDGSIYNGATMLSNGTSTFAVGGTSTATMPADTLTLALSEDAYKGNANFELTIDGNEVTTPQPVTTLRSAGAWQNLTFNGNFGAGSHAVSITFTNDAYGGTATTDRNLYVNGITANGTHYGSGVSALMTTGSTVSFTITTTH